MNMNYGWRRNITHCPAGHEYSEENTYHPPANPIERCCRTCAKDRYLKNKDKVMSQAKAYLLAHPEKRKEYQKRSREKHKEKNKERNRISARQRRIQLRQDLLTAYGRKCAWCSQARMEFLQLDHVNNDGKADRDQYSSPTEVYRAVRNQGYPKDRYQFLCGNCHSAKSFYKMTKEQVLAGPIDLHLS